MRSGRYFLYGQTSLTNHRSYPYSPPNLSDPLNHVFGNTSIQNQGFWPPSGKLTYGQQKQLFPKENDLQTVDFPYLHLSLVEGIAIFVLSNLVGLHSSFPELPVTISRKQNKSSWPLATNELCRYPNLQRQESAQSTEQFSTYGDGSNPGT